MKTTSVLFIHWVRCVLFSALALSALSSMAQVGKDWRLRSPQPWGDTLTSVVKTDTRIIAVGSGTAVMQSLDDGATWSAQQLTPMNPSMWEVPTIAWNGATGAGSKLLYSSEDGLWTSVLGDDWTRQDTNLDSSGYFGNVTWTSSGWVAIQWHYDDDGNAEHRWITSADGAQWTILSTLPASPNSHLEVSKVIDTGAMLVVVGLENQWNTGEDYGVLLSTSDGTTWNRTLFTDDTTDARVISDVTRFGATLVAVGSNFIDNLSYTSTDGINWTRHVSGAPLGRVVATSTHIVSSANGTASVSSNGSSWTEIGGVPTGVQPSALIWTGTKIIAAGSSGAVFFADANGTNWVQKTPAAPLQDFLGLAVNPGGVFVASNAQGQVFRSTNGDTWTQVTSQMFEVMVAAAWAGTRFVAAAGPRFSSSSADGSSWSSSEVFGTDWMTAIGVSGNTMIAVGDDGFSGAAVLYRSNDDGASWTSMALPAGSQTLHCVARIGSQWIAGGDGDTLLTSPDGSVWTKRAISGGGMRIASLAANGTIIVAMSEFGGDTFFTSTNGATWTKRRFPGFEAISSVVWTGSNFVATGSDGAAYTSPDGTTWTRRFLGTGNWLQASVWDGAQVLAVGNAGIVMSSDTVPVVSFTRRSQRVLENEGAVPFEVKLSLPPAGAVTVPLSTSGTAGAADFTAPASVTFAAGETSKIVNVVTAPDTDVEADETVQITLGGVAGIRTGSILTHTITITDDDSPPTVGFINTTTIANEHTGTVGIGIVLSWPAPGAISVPLTTGGTAAGADYAGLPANVDFASGEVSKFITLTLVDDVAVEADEDLVLTLGAPSGAVLGANDEFTLTVKDNDPDSEPATRWTLRTPQPTANAITALAASPARVVGFTDGNEVITSDDNGVSWTRRFHGEVLSEGFYGAAWTGSLFVGVGDNALVITSPDGVAWASSKLPDAGNHAEIDGLAIGASGMVAVGDAFIRDRRMPLIYYSADGLHWRKESPPAGLEGELQGITWTGTQFVAVGFRSRFDTVTSKELLPAPIIITSPDGRVWADRSAALADIALWSVTWAGSKVVAFDETRSCYTSVDGITWTKRSTGALGDLNVAAWNGSKLVAAGAATATSTDGIAWVQRASPTKNEFNTLIWNGSTFVAACDPGGIYTSPDGIVWTKRSTGVENRFPLIGAVWSGTQFVAVGGNEEGAGTALIMTSPDGTTWTQRPSSVPTVLTRVAWSGSLFAAVGGGGVILTSPDGIAWTPRASGVTLNLFGIVWAGNQFVAVGGNEADDNLSPTGPLGSVVLTSPNGLAWMRRTIPTTQPLESIEWNGSQFVAVGRAVPGGSGPGAHAEVLTSTDAVIWTHRDSGLDGHDLHSVAWNGSLFVAVGDGMSVLHSADGITWSSATGLPTLPGEGDPELYSVLWATDRWVMVGEVGLTFTSLDGDNWTWRQSELSGGALVGMAWSGVRLVGVGDQASVQTSGPGGVPATPTVQFELAASSHAEAAGVARVLVRMSAPPVQKVSLPFVISSTHPEMFLTGTFADLIQPVSPLVFNPGETSKFINLTIKNDVFNEVDETLGITLTAPASGATLGARTTHALTVVNDDFETGFAPMGQPSHQLLAVGEALMLTVSAAGSPPLKYQWKKNNVAIAGATSPVYFVPKVTLANAGAYTCTVTNHVDSSVSDVAQVGVYEQTSKNVASLATTAVVMTQTVAGNGLTLAWHKDSSPSALPPSARIVYDATKKMLTLKTPLDTWNDPGEYQCKITQAASAMTKTGNSYHLGIVTAKPTLDATILLPSGQIGVAYSHTLAAAAGSAEVASWSAVGLPTGLTVNARTGEISGYPAAVAVNKAVTITATNGNGSASRATTITVSALPTGLAGLCNGLMDRHPQINRDLGGKVTLTITATGSFTGSYLIGTSAAQPFTGQAIADSATTAHGSTTFLAGGNLVTVSFTYDAAAPANTGGGSVTVNVPGTGLSYTTAMRTWRTHLTPASYAGRQNFAMRLTGADIGDQTLPQGIGYGTATIGVTGTATYVGKLGDGVAWSASSFIARDGRSPVYLPLYAGKGSLITVPLITLRGSAPFYADSSIVDLTSTTWVKLPDISAAAARTYLAGWSARSLVLEGSEYPAPTAGNVVMDMGYTFGGPPNAFLNFSEGGIASTPPEPDLEVNVRPMPSTAIDPVAAIVNPRKTTLVVTGSTGALSGSFVLVDAMPNRVLLTRSVPFTGLIVRKVGGMDDEYEGVGVFSLPQLPSGTISPMPLPTTTPILSGRIELRAN